MKTFISARKFLAVLTFFFCFGSFSAYAGGSADGEEKFNISEMIMHHILDAHEWHIITTTDDNGEEHHVSVPLPVILYGDKGFDIFLSSAFDHHTHVAEVNGTFYKNDHEHIYYADAEGKVLKTSEGENFAPMDFSITKNAASMFIAVALLILIFTNVAKNYKGDNYKKAPKGLANAMEAIIVYMRDEVIVPNIGEKKAGKYLPYIMTVFFFIWFNNLLGLIPTGANTSGNIAFTMVLALLTLLITVFSGNGNYWRHIFATPGVPVLLYPIMIPVELIGIFTKPFALMIRLFANISAGHTIILSLIGLTFVFKSYFLGGFISALVVPALFMLELFVALLQAYIFALLSSLFIGQAVEEAHH